MDLHIAEDIFRKKWEEVEMEEDGSSVFQGDLKTANVNPLWGGPSVCTLTLIALQMYSQHRKVYPQSTHKKSFKSA